MNVLLLANEDCSHTDIGRAAGSLRSQGHRAELAGSLRDGLAGLLAAHAVCVLPGWQSSPTAMRLFETAGAMRMPIYCLRGGTIGTLIPRVRVIGLSGYARAGKDTVARTLTESGWTRVGFADVLKLALYRLNPIINNRGMRLQMALLCFDDPHGPEAQEYLKAEYPQVRALHQRLGTEVGREMFGPNFWIDQAMRRIPDGTKVVFTDCRFPSEAEAVRDLGGQLWRVERPGTGPVNGHSSETALDDADFDVVIVNDSTLDVLAERVRRCLDRPAA